MGVKVSSAINCPIQEILQAQ